uniref:Uncharacterized protein n=1 Tax=Neolamprologus brichardi TaxID=32507 RepID=A0A3Q4HP22_NEOBR
MYYNVKLQLFSGCYGFWCCPCLTCTVVGQMGDHPVISVGIRYIYTGSICKDIMSSCFCVWCSWCEMHRELQIRKKSTSVINMPAPVKSTRQR